MKTKFGIIAVVAIIVIVSIGAVLINYNLHSTMKTMQFIEGRIRPGGTIVDYDQSICVESAEDLGWWKKGGNWYVMYGKLQLEFTPKQLEDRSSSSRLAVLVSTFVEILRRAICASTGTERSWKNGCQGNSVSHPTVYAVWLLPCCGAAIHIHSRWRICLWRYCMGERGG